MTPSAISIVGIGGTTRAGSTSERMLINALGAAVHHGAQTRAFLGADLIRLPIYDPKRPERHPEATTLVEAVRTGGAVIVASPGYHGGISGMVKNAIDYLEDLRDANRHYLTGRAWGSIAAGAEWRSVYGVLNQLGAIGIALRAWTVPKGVGIGPNSSDADASGPTELMVTDLVWFVREPIERSRRQKRKSRR